MTERSKRRAAELEVVNDAVWLASRGALAVGSMLDRIEVRRIDYERLLASVRRLEALDLASPGRTVANTNAPQTAHDAAAWMKERAGQAAVEVYDCIMLAVTHRGLSGMTSDEVERRLHRPHQTVSARINQRRDNGFLVDTGERRNTGAERKGRPAIVWAPSEMALAAERELRRF
jgi:hypothetical protein